MHHDRPIAILGGAGYVGLITAVGLGQMKKRVVCVDLPGKIAALRAELDEKGEPDLFEPGLAEALGAVSDRLVFTAEYRDAISKVDVVFVAVGTPNAETKPDDDGLERSEGIRFEDYHGSNLIPVRNALDAAVDAGLCEQHLIVMKSTVPAETWRVMSEHIDRRRRERGQRVRGPVPWVSCPEFLREGSALRDFREPDRIVIGCGDPGVGDRIADLFGGLERQIERMDTTSAEIVKLGSNGLLATKITFANELANLCDLAGADVSRVSKEMGKADDVGPYFLRAGVGFGGSCFPKDVRALRQLAADSGESVALVDAVLRVNDRQSRRAVEKLEDHLGHPAGKHVALLGLAFKPNTNDVREAPALKIMKQLVDLGTHVRAFDPHVSKHGGDNDPGVLDHESVNIVGSLDHCFEGADAVILVTEWAEFEDQDWDTRGRQMNGKVVIDGRRAVDAEAVLRAGLIYDAVGRRVLGAHGDPEPMPDEDSRALTAEAADAYRAVKAAFGEGIRSLCRTCDADAERVARGIGLDHRIGEDHLTGSGSSEYSEAILALQWRAAELGYTFDLLEALEPVRAWVPESVRPLFPRRIGCLG